MGVPSPPVVCDFPAEVAGTNCCAGRAVPARALHDGGKGFTEYVDDHLLCHRHATAGIAKLYAREDIRFHFRRIRGSFATENLHDTRQRFAAIVAGESMHGQSGGMTQ